MVTDCCGYYICRTCLYRLVENKRKNGNAILLCPNCRGEIKAVDNVDPNASANIIFDSDRQPPQAAKKNDIVEEVKETLERTQMHELTEEHNYVNEESNSLQLNPIDTNIQVESIFKPEFEIVESKVISNNENLPSSKPRLIRSGIASVRIIKLENGGGSIISEPRSLMVKSFKGSNSLNIS